MIFTLSIKKFQCIALLILIPSLLFGQQKDFPYQLKKMDITILGIGGSAKLYATYRENNQALMTYNQLVNLNKTDINKFDRISTNYWDNNLDTYSDFTSKLLIAAPSFVLAKKGLQKEWKNCITYGIMYMEVAILTKGLTDLTKTMVKRKRPFLYNSNINISEREELMLHDNIFDSFFSGHTSASFAMAVFFSKTYADIYGNNLFSKIIWGAGLSIAGTTGYLRYKSGQHYPTDILTGAIVGSAIGYCIPLIHKQNAKFQNISLGLNGSAFNFTYAFN